MSAPESIPARPRVRLRRNPVWLVAGLLAVCLGGLTTAWVVTSATASEPVLRVNRTIHRGEVIAAPDLSVVLVARSVDVASVPGDRLGDVAGQAAVSDLVGGSLLVEGSWGDPALPTGRSRVGVRLEAGRFPSVALRPGASVLVVALPPQTATSAEPLPASVQATLAVVPAVQSDGSFVADLTVPAESAELVARLASAGRVSLVEVRR